MSACLVMLFSGVKSAENATQTLQQMRCDYADVFTNCEDLKFKGRGQRDVPAGDIYRAMEVIVLCV